MATPRRPSARLLQQHVAPVGHTDNVGFRWIENKYYVAFLFIPCFYDFTKQEAYTRPETFNIVNYASQSSVDNFPHVTSKFCSTVAQ